MRVVIVGGGFAAVQFAKTLRKKLRASECELVVFNRENHKGTIECRERLGGLLKYYEWQAA